MPDIIYGSSNDDFIEASTAYDIILAEGGNDTVSGGEEQHGGDGNDVLQTGNGDQYQHFLYWASIFSYGENGDDTYVVNWAESNREVKFVFKITEFYNSSSNDIIDLSFVIDDISQVRFYTPETYVPLTGWLGLYLYDSSGLPIGRIEIIDQFGSDSDEFAVETLRIGEQTFDLTSFTSADEFQDNYVNGLGNSVDNFTGTVADDYISGFGGTDRINGNSGNDTIVGGSGDDTLIGSSGSDLINGGLGNDQIWAGSDDDHGDLFVGHQGNDTIGGGEGDDTIVGDVYNQSFLSSQGTDVIFGGTGDDLIITGGWDDELGDRQGVFEIGELVEDPNSKNIAYAGAGSDRVYGSSGSETIGGGSDADYIDAGAGKDLVYGGKGDAADTLYGNNGDDTLYGGQGDDIVSGGQGNDLLYNGAGEDLVSGGSGNDTLWGGGGDDTLSGGDDADIFGFNTSSGHDTITDFNISEDTLLLENTGITDIASVASDSVVNEESGLLLSISSTTTIFLVGLTTDNLDEISTDL